MDPESSCIDNKSAEFISGVRVIIQDLSENPHCAHGPTLLFSRVLQEGRERRFYACSACRDRKECSFFMLADETKSTVNKEQKKDKLVSDLDLEKHTIRISNLHKLPSDKRAYCYTCTCLFNMKRKKKHAKHEVLEGVSDYQIQHPSQKLLKPLKCSKKEAQYMFSSKSVNVICNILNGLDITFVICIGAPRIHEHILQEYSPKITSVLFDIDKRYHEFFKSSEFCHYNMFNNHFFDGKEFQKPFLNIMGDKNQEVAIVIDPPFGGRVEPLAHTLQSLQKLRINSASSVKPMPVLWTFPYFMEPHIQGCCPDFTMLDYKVDYENHLHFKTESSKRGSPVRLFTNVSPSRIPLPKSEGYHHCTACDRWVTSENKHCDACNACTSKDGRTYVHCELCKRCVKPSWVHCMSCDRCCLLDHTCGVKPPTPVACFCGSLSHVKKDCPLLKKIPGNLKALKRKASNSQGSVANKKGKIHRHKVSKVSHSNEKNIKSGKVNC